jgi:hypothetical protein
MQTDLTFLKPLIRRILVWPEHSQWTVQGFGFLRTYFGPPDEPKRFRLNLWDSKYRVDNVSVIHDHPWHFTSVIVAGVLCNYRYVMQHPKLNDITPTHSFTTIKTGEGGGMEKSPIEHCVLIQPHKVEFYSPGDTYYQHASEIHETAYKDGTVTLNERVPTGDGEHARVFWPYDTDWVDAMPRPATADEVSDIVSRSLARWF